MSHTSQRVTALWSGFGGSFWYGESENTIHERWKVLEPVKKMIKVWGQKRTLVARYMQRMDYSMIFWYCPRVNVKVNNDFSHPKYDLRVKKVTFWVTEYPKIKLPTRTFFEIAMMLTKNITESFKISLLFDVDSFWCSFEGSLFKISLIKSVKSSFEWIKNAAMAKNGGFMSNLSSNMFFMFKYLRTVWRTIRFNLP